MLQVARLAPNLLHEAGDRVVEFLQGQINEDGGGKNRAGESDLYYTVFTLDGLIAMQAQPPVDRVRQFLLQYNAGETLDFVHLCCLARCWTAIGHDGLNEPTREAIIQQIEKFRSEDGGYHATAQAAHGSVYHSFLALGAHQDLTIDFPDPRSVCRSVYALQTEDGAFANDKRAREGTTTTTAAAVTILRHLAGTAPEQAGAWLRMQCHLEGGFKATPRAPMPDLLSTATALHALAGMHIAFDDLKEKCLDFVDSLWTGQAFCGHWADDMHDSEYTFYALLALGHLSL